MVPSSAVLSATLLVLVTLVRPAPARPVQDDAPRVPFEEFAAAFEARRDLAGQARTAEALEAALQRHCVSVRLGLFDLRYPRDALEDGRKERELRDIAGSLIGFQEHWIGWLADPELVKECKAPLKALRSWTKGWKAKGLPTPPGEDGRADLLDLLRAKDSVREASRWWGEVMTDGRWLGRGGAPVAPIILTISPTRHDFLELGSYVGCFDERNRQAFHVPGLAMWTAFHSGDLHVIATEYPLTVLGGGDITQGQSMTDRDSSGMAQQVVQHAAELLLHQWFDETLPEPVQHGLMIDSAIDLYGENNVRSGGGQLGLRTRGQERFVPEGGQKPGKNKARVPKVRWREDKGKGWFLDVLRDAQKDGFKLAREEGAPAGEKHLWFELSTLSNDKHHAIRGPFLAAAGMTVPPDFLDDSQEFLRAYQAAFCHWLREEAAAEGSREDPPELLARVLRAEGGYEERIADVYGVPWSHADPAQDSLERRFLDWLAKGR